jgi:5-methylcytosine-specific restriction endonuclease McrA
MVLAHQYHKRNMSGVRSLRIALEIQNYECFYCNLELRNRYKKKRAYPLMSDPTYDHLIPKSKGGGDGLNLVIAHRNCNYEKADRMPTEEEMRKLETLNVIRKNYFYLDDIHLTT